MPELRRNDTANKLLIPAVLLSATAFYFGMGLHPHWWATWLAPIPALLLAFRQGARPAWLSAYISFFLGNLTWWGYFSVLELPFPVRAMAFLLTPAVFACAVSLSRALLVRRHYWLAMLAAPATWVTFDYLMSLGRNGTAMNFSYSQMDFLPVLQIASLVGIWGIEFIVLFLASAIAVSITVADQPRSLRMTTISAAIVFLVLGFGAWRLTRPASGERVKVGLAASDARPLLASDESKSASLIQSYGEAIDDLAKKGAELVLLPEKIGPVFNKYAGPTLDTFQGAARRNNVWVIAGVDQHDTPLKHNLAFVFAPDGSQQLVYEKHFMVPGWEDGYERGNQIARFPAPHANWGLVICKDMDFPGLSREYANQGVRLMFAPAWDFVVDDWLHGRMAVLRGVESGFSLVRSAKQGLMTITDDRGRVLLQGHSTDSGPATAIGNVPLGSSRTLYARYGNWFAWLNLAGLAVLLALAFTRQKAAPPK